MTGSRALWIVLDSVGIGGAPDAAAYGDAGANTFGHIAEACEAGRGDRAGVRSGPLALPHLASLGLGHAAELATGRIPPRLVCDAPPKAAWGAMRETSPGKDTVSGHWELAGSPADFDWHYFPNESPAFPAALTDALTNEAGLTGILGNCHASGTAIIEDLGETHLRTGAPIVYTSADSVLQIAAHEEAFGLDRLYATCVIARRLCDPLRVGRVIARPFIGTPESGFSRTPRRKDYAMPPPDGSLLDRLTEAGRDIVSVGKIGDIFAHRSTGREVKAAGNDACLSAALDAFSSLSEGGLVFVNLVDFDSEYGHRRDVPGYAAALERFDLRLPEIRSHAVRPGDLVIITADHGNDPTFAGSDHTRESVPVLVFGPTVRPNSIGLRESLADLGASLAAHLGVAPPRRGVSWL